MSNLNIKKVDDKPMVIHTKEKRKLHVKSAPETKVKGRDVLTVDRSPKIAGDENTDKNDRRKSAMKIRTKGETVRTTDKKISRGKERTASEKQSASGNGKAAAKEAAGKSVQKESSMYAQYRRTKQDKENTIGKKNDTVGFLVSIGAKTALDQMEGGNEVYESYMAARNLSRPLESAADAGRRLYQKQAAKAREKRIKKVQAGKKSVKKR